jgi:hypothetical protein
MTDLQPIRPAIAPPANLLRALIDGVLPGVGGARVIRMHFPTGRPPQIHMRGEDGPWIAEWTGEMTPTHAQVEAERIATAGQIACLRADPVNGLLARPLGVDAKLPALRLVGDPEFAEVQLGKLGLRGPFGIDLVAHRLGKRAVLRIRHAGGTAFARLRPRNATQARLAADRHNALWQAMRDDPRMRLPRPMEEDPALGLSLYNALPGSAPRFRRLRGFVEIESISRALLALQDCQIEVPLHRPSDEIDVLRAWVARLDALQSDLAHRIAAAVDRLEAELLALPPMRPVLCHRDLHEGQILIHRGITGLMDFDTLRHGDPGLDIGNLQAHLILAGLRQGRDLGAYVTALERPFPHVPLHRITLWRKAALLRLALILSFTAEAPAVILSLLAETA